MKKLIVPILVICALFFIKTISANAFSGDYAYDISSFTITDSNVTISGWAAIKDPDGNEMHNINPTYTLDILAMPAGVVPDTSANIAKAYTRKTYTNKNSQPSYAGATSQPRDYTRAYFTARKGCNGPASGYPITPVIERANCVKNTSDNYFYINIDFKFIILTSELNKIFDDLEKNKIDLSKVQIYLNLNVTTSSKPVTVFGVSGFKTTASSRTINLGVQDMNAKDNRTPSKVKLIFHNKVTQVTNTVKYGFVQFNSKKFLSGSIHGGVCTIGSTQKIEKDGNCSGTYANIFFYDANSSTTDNYTVIKSSQLNDVSGYGGFYYNYYQVSIGIGNTVDGRPRAANGGATTAYIPAFWTTPIEGTYIYITRDPVIDTCASLPVDKQYCCRYPSDPICNPVQVCSDPDPEKKYCCKYPNDPMCKPPIVDEHTFPETNPDDKKDGFCSFIDDTKINFKYPKEGWGKILVTNDSCSISCQETLTATFKPTVSVRAGMGFGYPISTKSSRYCTAAYDNDGWKAKVDAAATSANTAYNNMVTALNEAKTLDTACGTKVTLTAPVPSCPSPYTDGRSGLTCRCNSCRTCYDSCPSTCHTPTYSCGTPLAPKTCGGTAYTCYVSCNPHSCSGSTSVSCPSQEGHSLSYNSSTDDCRKDICSNSRATWSTAQSDIAAKLSTAASYLSQYNSYVSTTTQLNSNRTTCDNYVANNQYAGTSNTKISVNVPDQSSYTITSNSRSEDAAYESARFTASKAYAVYQCNNRSYSAPSLVGSNSASSYTGTYCNFQTASQTYRDFWNKKSDMTATFEFTTGYYVQRYTGSLSTTSSSGYDYDGHYAYTDFFAPSGLNPFSVVATQLGPNLPGISNNLWSINPFDCQYYINNLIFPPEGDPNNDLYGNVGFMYRQVDLTTPFPSRGAGENWAGRESLITSKNYKIYADTPLYKINLTPSIMQALRGYGTNYSSFNTVDPYISTVVDAYIKNGTIIKGK